MKEVVPARYQPELPLDRSNTVENLHDYARDWINKRF